MRLNKPMRWTTGFALAVIALLAWNQSQYLGADQLISSYGAATCLSPYQRSNWASRRLYALADGLYGGLWRRTELYEYDLAARRSIRRALVHPERLPASCPGGTVPNKPLQPTSAARERAESGPTVKAARG
jgi:hypothetical protein